MKEGTTLVRGKVLARMRDTHYRVAVNDTDTVLARLSGKMFLNRIIVVSGDEVVLEMTPVRRLHGSLAMMSLSASESFVASVKACVKCTLQGSII
jgi:translation initiation factor IF-1